MLASLIRSKIYINYGSSELVRYAAEVYQKGTVRCKPRLVLSRLVLFQVY